MRLKKRFFSVVASPAKQTSGVSEIKPDKFFFSKCMRLRQKLRSRMASAPCNGEQVATFSTSCSGARMARRRKRAQSKYRKIVKDVERRDLAFHGIEGKRLTYRRVGNAAYA